ncbi:glutaredoxin [Halodesulfurarchaeum formicicum]|uniref:Glutaredoxin n=1 Tax=Halodesulfurarchaeum formicicum TaxID=1873524 RepID=A0A1D8S2Y0_9EURY|nr:glutaredoxin family protein [Halodesulfurarchaeum formicicum]AOW79706.1 glutaredoxin [Halodesulfurarchaeum formicicum]APE94956.1 glutaredoxin [Halodesulfurarchaeum formicicum]
MTITLYALDGCPACERVMETLDANEIEYEVHWVDALFSERDEVKAVSEQRGVPVLEDDDRSVVMANTDRIIEYVETTLA